MKSRFIESAILELAKFMIRMIGLFYIPGIHYPENLDLRGITPELFEIEIKAGVNLPASRFAEQQMHQWMYSQGIVDEQFIIEHTNIKDKQSIIDRLRPIWEAKQQAMLAQAEMAAQPQPPQAVQAGGA